MRECHASGNGIHRAVIRGVDVEPSLPNGQDITRKARNRLEQGRTARPPGLEGRRALEQHQLAIGQGGRDTMEAIQAQRNRRGKIEADPGKTAHAQQAEQEHSGQETPLHDMEQRSPASHASLPLSSSISVIAIL